MLLPSSLEELIPLNHPGRTVNQIIERIDLTSVYALYSENGSSSYHPKLLLKILVYGYLENCYSSRKLEKAIRENIVYMWLAGMQRPDHHTINRFRSERLRGVIGDIFAQVVLLLHEEGLLDIKEVYTDGTKIEANANRYTFVWGKAVTKSKERISAQLKELWEYAGSVASAELGTEETDFVNPSPQKVTQTVEKINRALEGKTVDKKVKQKLNYARKNWPAKLEEYARKQEVLGERNSFSKTDPDATFMRMKEDHMKNGQLKPAYNLQLSTHGQFVVNYSIHPNPNDTLTLKPHLELYRSRYGFYPSICTADAGYGSEENYSYLRRKQHRVHSSSTACSTKSSCRKVNETEPMHCWKTFTMIPKKTHYICPMGQTMEASGASTRKTSTGFVQQLRNYRAKNCTGCPLAAACKPGKDGKTLQINRNLQNYKASAKTLLTSAEGIEKRKQRATDVEPVFGNLKYNKGMGRYLLRGKEKVEVETGLLVIAHNLAKRAS